MPAKVQMRWIGPKGGPIKRAVLEVEGGTKDCRGRLLLELDAYPRRGFEGDNEAAQVACARQMLLDALDSFAGDAAVELVEAGAIGPLAGARCSIMPGHYYLKGRCGVCPQGLADRTAPEGGAVPRWQELAAVVWQRAAQAARAGHRNKALQLKQQAEGMAAGAHLCAGDWRGAATCRGL